MMLNLDAVLTRIRAYATHARLSPSALALKAGLGINSLADLHSSDWTPSGRTIRKVEAVIPADFMPCCEYPPPEPEQRQEAA